MGMQSGLGNGKVSSIAGRTEQQDALEWRNVSCFPPIRRVAKCCAGRAEGFTIRAMKRLAPYALLVSVMLVVLAPFAFAAAQPAAPTAAPAKGSDKSPAAPIASAISTVTGIAISPLLGTS